MVYTRRRDLWDLAQAKESRGLTEDWIVVGGRRVGRARGSGGRYKEAGMLHSALLLGEARQAQTYTADRLRISRNRLSRRGYFNVALARRGFR